MRSFVVALMLWTAPLAVAKLGAAELKFSTIDGHGGLPLNVMEVGNPAGPAILLIHGMAMGAMSFRPQFDSALAKDFRLVAYDLRGHGNSGKPWDPKDVQASEIWADDMAAVIAAAKLDKPVVVGWSYGGFVAADYVRKYGTAGIAGLNLVGSIAGLVQQPPPVGNMTPEEMKRRAAKQTSGNMRDNIEVVEATVNIFAFPGMTPAYREEMRTLGLMVPAYVRRAFVGRNLDHQDVTPKLVDFPMLITMGANDVAQAPEAYARLKAALPKAQYSVFENNGHLPFAQSPERFNAELAAFVRAVKK
ncbi:MAG: alpha/beta hydrolase [Rhodospirillaceae bacterium]|nr:alpha/beta hydrolase [Rhodospirillaceae bacterium]